MLSGHSSGYRILQMRSLHKCIYSAQRMKDFLYVGSNSLTVSIILGTHLVHNRSLSGFLFETVHDKSRGLIAAHDSVEGLRAHGHEELSISDFLGNKILFEFYSLAPSVY